MENIFEELGIPKKYLKHTSRDDRFIALVHKSWLRTLLKQSKLGDFNEKCKLESWPYTKDEMDESWMKVFIRIFKKREAKVIPLPRIRNNTQEEQPLLIPQLMQYIFQTNYKNLWKEAYKKYNSSESNKTTQVTLVDYNDVLREIIVRTYGCSIINTYDPELSIEDSKDFDVHPNIYPTLCGVETLNAIFLIHSPHIEHNLSDCVTFSPSILDKCYTKPLFLLYQIINTLKALHERSLTVGEITLSDIYLTEDLWIYIFPQLNSNIYIQELPKSDKAAGLCVNDCRKCGHKFDPNMKCVHCGIKSYDKVAVTNESLEKLCELWVNGQISNYTYLMSLNNLSGRRYGDPNCHYVFPWVTDFTSRCGKSWRDLKKSKYRLNKGDRQLDLTYENAQTQVPHHVSDVLSSITYYVYMSRRTPKSILCKHVRTVWVPAEYPSSIQRLQEWTPDECIPEFFSDPTVFKSIHDDLDDLEVPNWCSGPEDFIEKHREALESQHVSERLHLWIDLTFGYRLAGHAAVKAKNVCLQLVDGHTNLTSSGVVQLFMHPHPPKAVNLPFWGKTPPKLYLQTSGKQKRDHSSSSATISIESSRSEEEDLILDEDMYLSQGGRSPLALSKFLSRSRSSLNEDLKEQKTRSSSSHRSASLGPKNATFTSHVTIKKTGTLVSNTNLNTGLILLPKEFSPAQALTNLENLHNFFTKTFHTEEGKLYKSDEVQVPEIKSNESVIQNAFTNRLFESRTHTRATKSFTFPIDNQNILPFRTKARGIPNAQKLENQISCNYAEIIASRRTRELQILGCLIVEIFMPKQLRSLGLASSKIHNSSSCSLRVRLKSSLTVLKSCANEIPCCIRYIVNLLLQPDCRNLEDFKYPAVTDLGLPPPTAHLFLEPLLHSLIPFNEHFFSLYSLISGLKEFENVSEELDVLYHFDCNGQMCLEYESVERAKVLFAQNISECKVRSCARDMEDLFDEISTVKDLEIIFLLVPHIKQLIEEPPTSVLAAWYLFDSISRFLGPKKSGEILLEPILKLYETEPADSNIPYYAKIVKLYHHSFLLRLIVRFGLKCFLEYFVTPLVEAVGGYRDQGRSDFVLHTHSEKIVRKTSNLKNIDSERNDLSPGDDSSGSEKNMTVKPPPENVPTVEPEVFEFETEEQEEPLQSLIEHLELNISSDLPFNHSSAEEALDAAALDQELNLNLSDDCNEYNPPLMSPTIPIPSSFKQKDLTNISCDVGSKKSESDYLQDKKYDDYYSGGKLFDCPRSASSNFSSFSKNGSKPRRQESKISSMSSDSLIWLSHRLGPVLTARYLSRNLLKMLTLCYVGKENLVVHSPSADSSMDTLDLISIANSRVIGDKNAVKVLECLASIAALYGEQLILLQYLPHMSELIALCKRKLTPNLEGGLISCLALLKHIIPYICDSTLMDQLQDVILKNILHPTIRLLGSTKYTFPNGSMARNVLARKYLDTLYVLSLRMGADMTRTHLAVPALQRFFLIFDKISENCGYFGACVSNDQKSELQSKENLLKSIEESHFLEVRRDGTIAEWAIGGRPVQISHVRLKDSDSTDSLSPPKLLNCQNGASGGEESVGNQALEELQTVFTADLAYTAYIPFLKQIGQQALESSLKNHANIYNLCQEYEKELKETITNLSSHMEQIEQQKAIESTSLNTGSIGSNVAVIGNRIDVQEDQDIKNPDILSCISNKMENNVRHLRGNWLAYWEHEIGRSDKDVMFNFKQIKLQTFTGHSQSIKSLHVLDNENSFLSGSRDKTVKLWSLRSLGDGTSTTSCQSTYTSHKKSVLAIAFLDSLRLVASCDSVVHLWDPFMGASVGVLESSRYAPVNVLKSQPAPSSLLFAATTEGTLKVIDARICSYIHELKVTINPTGLIRCLAVSPSGNWIATGQASGQITVLDTRNGLVMASWRAHEGELLQLVAFNEDTIISSSLDQTVSIWNAQDGKFKFHMKGASDPVHCLNLYNNELISGTTANRIGVHTSVDRDASFSSTKLRSDAFKGLLTSMAVLPLNRLLLLGADTGNIHLLC